MNFELAPFALAAGYGEAIVPLADIKAHLNVLHDDEDDKLSVYRDAAIDQVERYCGVRLGPCEGLEWKAESLTDPLSLGVWPVTAINEITWLDSTGTQVTGNPAVWRIGSRDQILLKPGQSMPSGVAAAVVINFDAGFEAGTVPPVLVQAVKFFVAHLKHNASAVVEGTMSGEIPLGFTALCGRVRMPRI